MRVLIVEDDMIVAGGLGPTVTECGHELVGLAADRDTAVALLAAASVDVALVDLHLADGWTGIDVIRTASRNGAQALALTANPLRLPPDMAGAVGVIEKPYRDADVKAALGYLTALRAGDDAAAPPCLELAEAGPTPPRRPKSVGLAGLG